MKTVRWMLCIMALAASIIGCGEKSPDFVSPHGVNDDPHDPEVYAEWWDIYAVHDFNRRKNEVVYGSYGSLFFSYTGALTHVLSPSRTVGLSPEAVIWVEVSYTTRGRYTTHGNRFTGKKMTITTASTQRLVDDIVYHDPEAPGQPEIEERLAAVKSELETDTENFFQQKIQPLLKAGTEYTWEVEGKWLTLESPKHRIVLLHQATLGELETSSSWWWW